MAARSRTTAPATAQKQGTLAKYAEAVGIEYSTLTNYRRVAVAFESASRGATLTWAHHRALAARDDRLEWLARAVEEHWAVRQLESAVYDAPPAPLTSGGASSVAHDLTSAPVKHSHGAGHLYRGPGSPPGAVDGLPVDAVGAGSEP